MADIKDTESAASQSGAAVGESKQDRGAAQQVSRRGSSALEGSAAGGRHVRARPRDPFAMMERLSEEMDELFDSFFYGRPRGRAGRGSELPSVWAPDVEVCDEQNQLRVIVDLPGIPKDSVKIDVQEGALTIQGERREERTEGGEQEGYRRSERRYGSFYRTIPLPEGADAEQAQARMKDGVLEITVPVAQRKQSRRLEIQG